MSTEEKIFPDPKIPLTPGQIIFLGGIIGARIENKSAIHPKLADYVVSKYYWPSASAYKRGEARRTAHDPDVRRVFEVKELGSFAVLRPKPEHFDDFVVVQVIPKNMREFRKFMPDVSFGIFVKKVPAKLYAEVLDKGEKCDIELYASLVAKKYKVQAMIDEEVRQLLGIPNVQEQFRAELEKLRIEMRETIKEIVVKTIEDLATELFTLVSASMPQQRRRKVPYAKIQDHLLRMYGVYKVQWSGDIATIYCRKDMIDEVKKEVERMGGKVVEAYTSRFLGIVKADFSGVEV